jgi:hypothetical protein
VSQPEHPKLILGHQIQDALQHPTLAQGLEGAVLTRWMLLAELAVNGNEMGFVVVTSNAAGDNLHTWDQLGLLHMALRRLPRSP